MNINNPKILEEDPNFRDIGIQVQVFRKSEGSLQLNDNDRGRYILHEFDFKISADPFAHRSRFKELHESFKVTRIIEKIMQFLKETLDPVSYSMIKHEDKSYHFLGSPVKKLAFTVPGFFQLYGLDLRQNKRKFKKIAYDSVDINRKNDLYINFQGNDDPKFSVSYINLSMYENEYTSQFFEIYGSAGLQQVKLEHPSFYLEELINNSERMVKLTKLADSLYNLIRHEAKEAAKSVDIVGIKTGQDIPEAQTLIQNFAYGQSKREEDIDRSREATAKNTERSRKRYLIKEYKKYTRSRRPRQTLNALQQVKKDYSKPRRNVAQ
jgi:hypothetical protein